MANDIELTTVGNLTSDPELRYTQQGLPVVNFTVAQTPRTFDRAKNEWVDGEAVFLRCSAWREMAEHIAASFQKGSRVIATGLLKQRSYDTKPDANGVTEKRTSYELDVQEIGGSVRYGTTTYTKSASAAQNAQAAQMVGAPVGAPVEQQFAPAAVEQQFAPQAVAAPAQQFAAAPVQQVAAPGQQFAAAPVAAPVAAPAAPVQQFAAPQAVPAPVESVVF